MRRKKLLMLIGSICLALVLALPLVASCAAPTPTPAPEPVAFHKVWTLYHNIMLGQPHLFPGPSMVKWARLIEERTGGAVRVEVRWPGELPYKGYESLPVVRDRLVDVIEVCPHPQAGYEPLMDFHSLPFMVDTYEEGKWVCYELLKPMQEKVLARYNAKHLMLLAAGDSPQWYSKGPVTTMADMKGYKCRVYDKATTDMVAAWGATPILIPFVELYTALMTGVVDAVVTSTKTARDAKFYETLDYVTVVRYLLISLNHTIIALNKDAWAELPVHLQEIVLEVSAEIEAETWAIRPPDEVGIAALVAEGMTALELEPGELDKLKGSVRFMWAEWAERLGPEGETLFRKLEEYTGRKYLP